VIIWTGRAGCLPRLTLEQICRSLHPEYRLPLRRSGVPPQSQSDRHRIDIDATPPRTFVTFAMKLVGDRCGKAGPRTHPILAAQGPRKTDMVWIRGLPAAYGAELVATKPT
jgi:hypothetical protein